jgi:hypothetical protein
MQHARAAICLLKLQRQAMQLQVAQVGAWQLVELYWDVKL